MPFRTIARRSLERLLPLLLLAGVGCGWRQDVLKVSGTVTRNGQAVPNLWLTFEPDEGRPSWGKTDERGQYTLSCYGEGDGAHVGSHRVYVTVKARSPEEELKMLRGELRLPAEVQAIRAKYGSRDTSPLRFEVKENNQVIGIALD